MIIHSIESNGIVKCLCCDRKYNSFESEFYCKNCVFNKHIHTSEIGPIKWYFQLHKATIESNERCDILVKSIKDIISTHNILEIQGKKFRIQSLKESIEELKHKIATRNEVKHVLRSRIAITNQKLIALDKPFKEFGELIEKNSKYFEKFIGEIQHKQKCLQHIQRISVEEIFKIFPITSTHQIYEICGIPMKIRFSDTQQWTLEPDGRTASGLLLLSQLLRCLAIVLDRSFCSMDINAIAIRSLIVTASQQQLRPLQRDEVVRLFQLLAHVSHFLLTATAVDRLPSRQKQPQRASLPLAQLRLFSRNLKAIFREAELLEPYRLQQDGVFESHYMKEMMFDLPGDSLSTLDFIEVSGDIPLVADAHF